MRRGGFATAESAVGILKLERLERARPTGKRGASLRETSEAALQATGQRGTARLATGMPGLFLGDKLW
jgi:hypothetical protein